MLLPLLAVALAASLLLGLTVEPQRGGTAYPVLVAVVMLALWELVPYWLYRERKNPFPAAENRPVVDVQE
jgi:hypothetical protein